MSQNLRFLQGCEDEAMGMQVRVNLDFNYADSSETTGNFRVQAIVTDKQNSTELEFELSPVTEIQNYYYLWKNNYYNLVDPQNAEHSSTKGFHNQESSHVTALEVELKKKEIEDKTKAYQAECHKYSEFLCNQLNQWLLPIKTELEKVEFIQSKSEIYFVINTQNITSETITETLHKIPWREWNYFTSCDALEAVLYLNETESNTPSVVPSAVDDGIFRRVRITSIFGDVENIQEGVERDKEEIEKLEKRGAELIHLEQPQRQDLKKLWDEPCDILFYSGHSHSEINSTVGSFAINEDDDLSLEEISNTFREAIKKGLKIAVFNSCDGLGLACELAKLGLPYIVVWRESVPDKIAQKFLEYFLSSYSNGKSLFDSVRDARIKLKELTNKADSDKQIPGLEWLPIICVSTKNEPPLWEDLGGLTGKLPDSPYQGLSAFGEEDAEYFFGKEKFIQELVKAVNTKSLVPIIGVSGSGKSSVVFAGLVPRLREIGMQIISFRPGNNPFDSLAVALKSLSKETEVNNHRLEELELEVNLENDEKALCRFIEDLINLTSQRFILIIDQFEELYTLTPEAKQQPFLNALLYAVEHAPNFCVVFTLRADFYGHAISHPKFSEELDNNNHNCSPMNTAELRAAIEQPAAKLKVELESGLTDKLIDELGEQAGSLPLLEFTLLQLWDKHDKWYLTHQAYKEIGGLKKALAKYADGIINPLSAVDKEKAERIFIQLISPGEGTEDTKRKATRGEVGEDNWDLVEKLANQRLVVTGWDEENKYQTVEIIHEALIREWEMLRNWIQSNRRFRIWQERLQVEVMKWCENRDEKYLLSGGNLGEVETWYFNEKYRGYLSDVQGEFIRESLEKRDKKIKEEKRKQKQIILGFAGFSIVSLIFSGFVGWNWIQSEIKGTQEKLNSLVATSKISLNVENYADAQFTALKAKQLLEKTWWQQWIPEHIEQKVNIALYQTMTLRSEAKHTLEGHKDRVNEVRFSPDGKTIVTASWDTTVKLWSIDGQLLHTLEGHRFLVSDVVFSPDGKTIATASRDGTVKLWSIDGQFLNTFKGHKSDVTDVRFSPDGKTIASASKDNKVKLWSVDGQFLNTFKGHKSDVTDVRFSPDGKTIASASRDKTVKLWSADGQLLHTFKGYKSYVNEVRFSPDGKTIAFASQDGTVKLWSVDGQLLHTLSGNESKFNEVRFSPDGKTIASASLSTVKLWSVDGQLLHSLQGHKGLVTEVRFSPDGKNIASASEDKTVKLWSVDGQLLHSLQGHKGWVNDVKFSPNGKTIATASRDKTVKMWSVDGQLFHNLQGHKFDVRDVRFSPDGKTIASASEDKTVKLWSVDGQLLHTLQGHNSSVNDVKFSPDAKTIASASLDTVKLWSVDGQLLYSLQGHNSSVNDVRFSPDGKTIATASADRTVKLWSVDGQLLHTLQGHNSSVNDVRFSPDGKTIASASRDKTVKLWSVDGQLLYSLQGHKNWVYEVRFSPDGKTIASASKDKTVKLWSVDGHLLHSLEGHKDAAIDVRFSPDGKTIASASWDKTVKLWSVDGQLLNTLLGHKNFVNDVRFSPDGKTIATASGDRTVKLWSLDGQLLHTLSGHKDAAIDVRFSPDGKTIATASADRTVKLWNWNFDNLLMRGCNQFQDYLVEHLEKLEELKVCQNPEILTKVEAALVEQGEELAKDGDYQGAVEKFRKAKKWNPKLDINTEEKAKVN